MAKSNNKKFIFKRDKNQLPITEALLKLGFSVKDLSHIGDDCLDILVGYGKITAWVEIKNPASKYYGLSDGQEFTIRTWQGLAFVAWYTEDIIDEFCKVLPAGKAKILQNKFLSFRNSYSGFNWHFRTE